MEKYVYQEKWLAMSIAENSVFIHACSNPHLFSPKS